MNLNQYLISQEGWFRDDIREENIDLLKKKNVLLVISTSHEKFSELNINRYLKSYGFSKAYHFGLYDGDNGLVVETPDDDFYQFTTTILSPLNTYQINFR